MEINKTEAENISITSAELKGIFTLLLQQAAAARYMSMLTIKARKISFSTNITPPHYHMHNRHNMTIKAVIFSFSGYYFIVVY
jgi:hypothetical protein